MHHPLDTSHPADYDPDVPLLDYQAVTTVVSPAPDTTIPWGDQIIRLDEQPPPYEPAPVYKASAAVAPDHGALTRTRPCRQAAAPARESFAWTGQS